MASQVYIGMQRIDGDNCRIYYRPDDGTFVAENPMGSGYNWVSSGGKFKRITPSPELRQKALSANGS